jgi:hypothetical protein
VSLAHRPSDRSLAVNFHTGNKNPNDAIRKRDEISASIRIYEKKIVQTHADLAHVAHRSISFSIKSMYAGWRTFARSGQCRRGGF